MSKPLLSVVIPTYNEAANVAALVAAVQSSLEHIDYEIVVVDDNSSDGTAKLARAAGARVIVRETERGLATAVVRGLQDARGQFVAVMDSDFQHPPQVLARMLDTAQAQEADLVVGSRYAEGGTEGSFGLGRRLLSRSAKKLSQLALPPVRQHGITDPMSGLFLVRRAAIDVDVLQPMGYKVLLEILGRCPLNKIVEVGYEFGSRNAGGSKLGPKVMGEYIRHLGHLASNHPDNGRLFRFGLVGASGVVVNLGLVFLLHGLLGWHDLLVVPLAVEASIIWNFFINDRFTFHDRRNGHRIRRLATYNAVSLVAIAVNLVVYTILQRGFGVPYLLAEFAAIVVAFSANYAGHLHWTYGTLDRQAFTAQFKRALPVLPILLIGFGSGVFYLADLDRVNEIYFDEHFYVSVARQIDNGIWEDPCWINDSELPHRPLNYEHPPLAKLIMAWSVQRFDTEHAIFEGCRSPDNTRAESCNLVEYGAVLSSHKSTKTCYDAFLDRAKTQGNPFAWRAPSAVLGAITVTFAGLAARRLFGSTSAGVLASGFVVLDNLMFSSSRLAILDIYPTAFTVMAVWAATFPSKKGVTATALFLALGFACKYTVVFAGPPVALLALWTQRRAGLLTRRRFDFNVAAFVLTPLAVLVASFAPWWRIWIPEMGFKGAVLHWFKVQSTAFEWGQSGYQTHPYASPPVEWFAMAKPTFYYHVWGFGDGTEGWVYALGNPLLWWIAALAAIAAIVVPVARWIRAMVQLRVGLNPLTHFRGEPRVLQALFVSALLPMMTYAAFFLVDRVTFLFYMTLVVPLLVIPLAGWLSLAWRQAIWPMRLGVLIVVLMVLASFVWYYPVVSALRLQPEWHDRIMSTLPWMSYNPE